MFMCRLCRTTLILLSLNPLPPNFHKFNEHQNIPTSCYSARNLSFLITVRKHLWCLLQSVKTINKTKIIKTGKWSIGHSLRSSISGNFYIICNNLIMSEFYERRGVRKTVFKFFFLNKVNVWDMCYNYFLIKNI